MKMVKYFPAVILLALLLSYCNSSYSQQTNLSDPSGKQLDGFRKAKNGVYVIAHRGAHIGIPENSLAAYQKAIDLGCDFVEIDIRTTKDSQFVSIHNSTIDEYANGAKGKVSEHTLAELRSLDIGSRVGSEWKDTRIPTFEEILKLCQGRIGIYLDLKAASIPALVNIIKHYKMERDILWYIPASCMKEIGELVAVCPECIAMPDPGPASNIEEVLNHVHTQMLATDMGELNESFVKIAHRNHAMVTVDENKGTPAEWTQILDWKTDGIQTDRPAELISFLNLYKLSASKR